MSMDKEDAEQVAEDMANVDPSSEKQNQAFGVLFGSILLGIVGVVAAVWLGFVQPDVTVTATISVGWIIEYFVAGFVGLVLAFLIASFLIWLPGNFRSALVRAAAGMAENSEYVTEESPTDQPQQ
jgi:hypothetical protein